MYTVTKTKKKSEGREYSTYGIYYDDEYNVSDVSADREAVEKLARDYNKYNLDPIHLYDVIEDFLQT